MLYSSILFNESQNLTPFLLGKSYLLVIFKNVSDLLHPNLPLFCLVMYLIPSMYFAASQFGVTHQLFRNILLFP